MKLGVDHGNAVEYPLFERVFLRPQIADSASTMALDGTVGALHSLAEIQLLVFRLKFLSGHGRKRVYQVYRMMLSSVPNSLLFVNSRHVPCQRLTLVSDARAGQ
jgi:hypothetical protein